MSRLSRSDIRNFLYETAYQRQLNENTINIGGLNIGFDASGIIIGDKKFSLTAITYFGDYPVTIKDIEPGEEGGLLIAGSTEVKDVKRPMSAEKIAQVKKEINAGKTEFVIDGKLADIKFKEVS